MSRAHYVWVAYAKPRKGWSGRWVSFDKLAKRNAKSNGVMVVKDIGEYKSVVTGEVISGRRHHREHLKQHGCVEVGNDFQVSKPVEMPPAAQDIKRAIENPLPRSIVETLQRESRQFNPERIYGRH